MKNRKILLFLIIILCIVSLFIVSLFQYKKRTAKTQIEDTEIIATDESFKNDTLEKIDEIEEIDDYQEEINTYEENAQSQETTNLNEQNTQEKKIQETSTSQTTTKSQVASNNSSLQATENSTTQSSQSQAVTQEPAPVQSTIITTPNADTIDNTEHFTVNDTIINKMKDIINFNPSSSMLQFGYNIVVDSSIVTQINGFTYTEARVKNSLAGRFGTIKIYARDYYVGNELRWTESFIL